MLREAIRDAEIAQFPFQVCIRRYASMRLATFHVTLP